LPSIIVDMATIAIINIGIDPNNVRVYALSTLMALLVNC